MEIVLAPSGVNVVSAVVHMDEKTPHMHLAFVPLTKDNCLSAKEILGNRVSLSKWQDDSRAHKVRTPAGFNPTELNLNNLQKAIYI